VRFGNIPGTGADDVANLLHAFWHFIIAGGALPLSVPNSMASRARQFLKLAEHKPDPI